MPTLLSVITGTKWYGLIALFELRISSVRSVAMTRMAPQHLVIDRIVKLNAKTVMLMSVIPLQAIQHHS
jgi:hypothetical protein